MRIWVSSLAKVHDVHDAVDPSAVVSLLAPGDVFPSLEGVSADRHHKIHLHDIREPKDDHVTPGEEHVRDLVTFLSEWRPDTPLLVHCWAGISRSTATAFIAACLHNPDANEMTIAQALRDASPTAYPNTLIIAHADKIMDREGRMVAAVAAMSEWQMAEQAIPFFIPAKF